MAIKARSGFSLIEVMMALTVIAICLSAFCGSLFTAQQIQTRTLSQSLALEEIQRVIEQIQNTNYSAVQSSWNNTAFTVPGLTPPAGSTTVCSVTIVSPQINIIPLRITVSWVDLEGPSTISVVYVHTNRGG